MQLAAPTSLAEVGEDGLIGQADIDASFNTLLGPVTATECARLDDSTFTVRFGRAHGPDLDFAARQVASVTQSGWHWTSPVAESAAQQFDIPELWGSTTANIDLLTRAARTIHNDAPIIRIPLDRVICVLALDTPVQPSPVATALMRAPLMLSSRALEAFAARRGIDALPAELRDGALYRVGLPLDELRTRAAYLSIEHQMLYDARAVGHPTLTGDTINILTRDGMVVTPATVIATVTEDTWQWANNRATNRLRQFGHDQCVPALVAPQLPVRIAQSWNLIDCAKEILGVYTHAFVPVSPTSYAVTLFQHPAFMLPPATTNTATAVLSRSLPKELDRAAAEAAYRARR
ncbi:hypothetical protein QVA66_02985 [Staphylococcus chromogenes]|nr:hypothetical protein [Staphylococcus chromogenes]